MIRFIILQNEIPSVNTFKTQNILFGDEGWRFIHIVNHND